MRPHGQSRLQPFSDLADACEGQQGCGAEAGCPTLHGMACPCCRCLASKDAAPGMRPHLPTFILAECMRDGEIS